MGVNKRNILLNAIRILFTIVLVVAIFFFVGPERILDSIVNFNLFFLPAIILLMGAILLFGAIAVFVLLPPEKKIDFSIFLKAYLSSWAVGHIFPGKMGEFSLPFFLKDAIPTGQTLAIVLVEKLVSFIVLFFFGLIFFLKFGLDFFSITVFSLIALIAVLFFIVSPFGRELLKRTIFRQKKELFVGFYSTLKACAIERKKALVMTVVFTTLRSLAMGLSLSLILLGFGFSADLIDLTALTSAVTLIAFVPVTISGLGLREGSFVFLSSFLGLSSASAAGAMVIVNLINYLVVLFIFYFLLSRHMPKLFGKIAKRKQKCRKSFLRSPQKEKLLLSCGVITKPGEALKTKLEIEKKIGGQLVGIAGISVRYGFIPALFLAVDEKHRSKGIGTELVKELLKKKKGPVFLTVTRHDSPQLSIYKKNGFRKLMNWRTIRGTKTMIMFHF
ncbi:MAG: flippase-like domain-containing protein [Candidatus Diapherotrites archaeon]